MSSLTDQIRHSVNNPLTSTDFDFTAVLDDVLSLDPPIDLRLRVERLSIDADGLLDRWTW